MKLRLLAAALAGYAIGVTVVAVDLHRSRNRIRLWWGIDLIKLKEMDEAGIDTGAVMSTLSFS